MFSKSVDTKPGSNWFMSLLLILFPGKEMKKLAVADSKYQQTNRTTKGNKPATVSKRKRPLNPQSQGEFWSQCSYYAEIIGYMCFFFYECLVLSTELITLKGQCQLFLVSL